MDKQRFQYYVCSMPSQEYLLEKVSEFAVIAKTNLGLEFIVDCTVYIQHWEDLIFTRKITEKNTKDSEIKKQILCEHLFFLS